MASAKSKPKKLKSARRLFIIFARDASEAVVFCRGPAAWFQVIRWDTKNDKFYPGAWIKGRIYPERCDLSPDGELLLYFVFHGKAGGTSYSYAYTGLSRSPWLSALGLWPMNSTWEGGGRFLDNSHITLDAKRIVTMKSKHSKAYYHEISVHPDHPAKDMHISFGSTPVYKSSKEIQDAEWCGRDQYERLIFVRDGKIFHRNKKGADIELADLSEAKPDPQPAPAWASHAFAR